MWTNVDTIASSVVSVAPTFAVPMYDANKVLISIAAVDVTTATLFQDLINTYKGVGLQAYLVESSTWFLIASTTGEICYNSVTSKILLASDSLDEVTSMTAKYLTNTNTAWRPDADYLMSVSGVNYNVNLKTYTDATSTLSWRIVVAGQVSNVAQSSDYTQTAMEAVTATKASVRNVWGVAQAISPVTQFQHGASDDHPLTTKMMTFATPAIQSSTQQALWAVKKAFNRNVGNMIVSFFIFLYCF